MLLKLQKNPKYQLTIANRPKLCYLSQKKQKSSEQEHEPTHDLTALRLVQSEYLFIAYSGGKYYIKTSYHFFR